MYQKKVIKPNEFYDKIASEYDNKWWYKNPDSRHIKELIQQLLQKTITEKSKVLDVGCGTCDTEVFLKNKRCEIVGLGISSNMLKIASDKIHRLKIDNISLVKGNAKSLPFKDNYFDYVISEFSLSYVDDLFEAFEEITRVLKTDGEMIVVIGNKKPMYILAWEAFVGNKDFIKIIKKISVMYLFPEKKSKLLLKDIV